LSHSANDWKNMIDRLIPVVLWALILLAVTPGDAAAYLDPGSGSFVFQIVISALLGTAVVLKTSWRRIIDYIFPSRRRDDSSHDTD
jgi:hypothetical protein